MNGADVDFPPCMPTAGSGVPVSSPTLVLEQIGCGARERLWSGLSPFFSVADASQNPAEHI